MGGLWRKCLASVSSRGRSWDWAIKSSSACDFKGTEEVAGSCASHWPWRLLPSSTLARTISEGYLVAPEGAGCFSLPSSEGPEGCDCWWRQLEALMGCLDGLIEKTFLQSILVNQLLKQLLVTAIHISPLTLSDEDGQSNQTKLLRWMGWVCPHSH